MERMEDSLISLLFRQMEELEELLEQEMEAQAVLVAAVVMLMGIHLMVETADLMEVKDRTAEH